jgi:menaquinone reductase, molybdopterin-binding-like subunit
MKIDRRAFLAFSVGGAAGTALSPLPWKVPDDISIWTQMWPWTPVPPDGAYTHVKSTCTLCPGGCGITVRKVDNRAVKIEGTQDHPINNGGVCLLGIAGLQLLYGPTRIKSPMKRVGERGQDRWVKISWKEAMATVTEKLGAIRSAGKAHSVAWIADAPGGTVPQLIQRFLTAYGSPNFIYPSHLGDVYDTALEAMAGEGLHAGLDPAAADFVISFGSGLLDGWGSPVKMFQANSAWQESGATVVQVEPRLSNTAAKADQWVPINPGTEGALALGIAHVLISESLYNSDFVSGQTAGFEEWKQKTVAQYSPEKAAEITGIDKSTIISLARAFAKAKHPLALCGRGNGMVPGSVNDFMAVLALNALAGNLNQAGGFQTLPAADYIQWPEFYPDSVASTGLGQPRIDGAGTDTYSLAKSLMARLPRAINTGEGYPLEALLISGANPMYTLPDSASVKKAFGKVPFIVSFSPYMDETAKFADIILPNHSFLERFEDLPTPVGVDKPMIAMAQPVVPPQYNTRNLGDVVIQLAQDLEGSVAEAFPWDGYSACLEETLADKWDALTENGYWVDDAYSPGRGFKTASGNFEFSNAAGANLPAYAPLAPEGDSGGFPLLLIPYDSMRLAGGGVANPPFLTKTVADTVIKEQDVFVQINPATAKAQGLKDGKLATLTTPVGEARVRVHLFEGVMPGVVAMPRGLGHQNGDEYLEGKGVNTRELIGPVEDPASGLDAAWGIRAKLV